MNTLCNNCQTLGENNHFCSHCGSRDLREIRYKRNLRNRRNISFYILILVFLCLILGIILLICPAKVKAGNSLVLVTEFTKMAISNHPAILAFFCFLSFIVLLGIIVSIIFMPRKVEEVK